MRLLPAVLLMLVVLFGLAACAGMNTAVGITTNQDAYAEEKRPR
jgi:hypothetical protein